MNDYGSKKEKERRRNGSGHASGTELSRQRAKGEIAGILREGLSANNGDGGQKEGNYER